MKSSRHHSAFTLIELLVVIAIIALLASLLMSVLGRTKLAAQQTQSLANLKQWGTALNLVLGENRQMFPVVNKTLTADSLAWYNLLPGYMSIPKYSEMTADQYPVPGKKSVWMNPAVPPSFAAGRTGQFMFSYAVNTYLNAKDAPYQLNATRIEHPGATVFMSEKYDSLPYLDDTSIKAFFQTGDDFATDGSVTQKQAAAAANILFCDGHVDLKKRSEFDPDFFRAATGRVSSTSTEPIDGVLTFIPYKEAEATQAP